MAQFQMVSDNRCSCDRHCQVAISIVQKVIFFEQRRIFYSLYSLPACGMYSCTGPRLEVSLARRQNLKLAWEDAWNIGRKKLSVKWLLHRSVRP